MKACWGPHVAGSTTIRGQSAQEGEPKDGVSPRGWMPSLPRVSNLMQIATTLKCVFPAQTSLPSSGVIRRYHTVGCVIEISNLLVMELVTCPSYGLLKPGSGHCPVSPPHSIWPITMWDTVPLNPSPSFYLHGWLPGPSRPPPHPPHQILPPPTKSSNSQPQGPSH